MAAATQLNDLAIDLHRVEKIYRGRVYALRGIDMRVGRGEIFGLLGPNGAGKSTLVKIMMTVVRPTRAEGMILGRPVADKPTLARIGYLPENHRFPRYLTGRQTLEFFAGLAGVPREIRKRRSAELLETVGMSDWADRLVGTYSKGMMQRVGLAQALAHDPELVLLDEPTDGVDPVGRREIRDVLLSLRKQGKTVFINSHLLSELELVCDRVAILIAGQVARQGTPDELSAAKQRYEIEVAVNGDQIGATYLRLKEALSLIQPAMRFDRVVAPPILGAAALECGTTASGQWIELQGTTLRMGTNDPADVQPAVDALRGAGFVIRRVQHVRPSLEDLFMEAVTGHTGGARALPGAALERRPS